jgi:CO/xanthine dehydrogenase Mo-binding subunit
MTAEVLVDPATGRIRVTRVVVSHDCGSVINPDGVRNQIEGNVIQGISRSLKEEVSWDADGVTSLTWETYPVLTFSEIPEIEIVIIDRPDEPPLGAGEPAICPVTAAVGNAVFAATGARIREVPFTPERVREAMTARR